MRASADCPRSRILPKTFRACVHIRVYAPPVVVALPQALRSRSWSPCSGGPGTWPDSGAWSQALDRVTLNPPGRLRSGYRVLVGRDERWPRSSIWPRRIKFWREVGVRLLVSAPVTVRFASSCCRRTGRSPIFGSVGFRNRGGGRSRLPPPGPSAPHPSAMFTLAKDRTPADCWIGLFPEPSGEPLRCPSVR